MKISPPVTAAELAEYINANVLGDSKRLVTGINEIHKVVDGDLTFVDFEKYYKKALSSAATTMIINKEVEVPEGKTLLLHDSPFDAYNALVRKFKNPTRFLSGPDAGNTISESAVISPGVVIGERVKIGANTMIYPNVVLYDDVEIGDDVVIHGNTVIGADAFYFKRKKERELVYDKMISCGRVIIENEVEIGAACTIDKGVSGDTVIGAGTKLDNQVHVGHGVVIGKNCLIAAQVGIGGKTIIEDNVILWGQVGVSKDLTIGVGAEVYAQSGVAKSIIGGKKYFGSPVEEARQKMKEQAALKYLPGLLEQLRLQQK